MLKTLMPSVLLLALLSTAPALAVQQCTRSLIGAGPELGSVVCQDVTSDRGQTLAVHDAPAVAQLYWQQVQHTDPVPADPVQVEAARFRRRWQAAAYRILRARQELRRQCPGCPR